MNRGSTSGWPSLPSAFVQFGISSWFDRPELIEATLQERDGTGIPFGRAHRMPEPVEYGSQHGSSITDTERRYAVAA